MMIRPSLLRTAWTLAPLLAAGLLAQTPAPSRTPQEVLGAALAQIVAIVEPSTDTPPRTFSTTLRVTETAGLGDHLANQTVDLALQAPDRLLISTRIDGRKLQLGRLGQELWIYAPEKQFGVIGSPKVPRFASAPDRPDSTQLPAIRLPLAREQMLLLPLLLQVEGLPDETISGVPCRVLRATPQPQAAAALKLPPGEVQLWIRDSDALPARIALTDGQGKRLVVELDNLQWTDARPTASWQLQPGPDAKTETVALSHLTRFIPAALSLLNQSIPTLGPATGERRLVAVEGDGRLEDHDGTLVLFLKGSPKAMGHQHGMLMKRQVRDLVDRILYGVGVGSSFEKGRWFFGEIEEAQSRIEPFIDQRYLREMDAMALAAQLEPEEVRLANFFPELFHCSGFAVFGAATVDGRLYHGRVLDYLRGVGLEPNAVVIIHQPDYGHAWANVGYGGFVGSVTAMNDQKISLGEMGGRGEGNWDGKPMAQLVREVMEQADTLDQAVEIMRRGPRTCEYYYVIADGKSKTAVGIAATPDTFEVIQPGRAHPRLPHAIPDVVLMSAGDRYEKLAERVQTQYGRLNAEGARHLMDRPVAMNSNIHSVLFAPETLDFWVANADSQNVASHSRYTHYNLRELLDSAPPAPATASR